MFATHEAFAADFHTWAAHAAFGASTVSGKARRERMHSLNGLVVAAARRVREAQAAVNVYVFALEYAPTPAALTDTLGMAKRDLRMTEKNAIAAIKAA